MTSDRRLQVTPVWDYENQCAYLQDATLDGQTFTPEQVIAAIERCFSPGHTDLMVPPETIGPWLEENSLSPQPSPKVAGEEDKDHTMTDDQIKHMVDRFLSWRLPETFAPDGGISFECLRNKGGPYEAPNRPTGTNVFDAEQATAMVRHMVEGLGSHPSPPITDEDVERALDAWNIPEHGHYCWDRTAMRAALESFVRGKTNAK